MSLPRFFGGFAVYDHSADCPHPRTPDATLHSLYNDAPHHHYLTTPTPAIPTSHPPPMAVTLPPHRPHRPHRRPEPYPTIPTPASAHDVAEPPTPPPAVPALEPAAPANDPHDKEKKYPCWMCHKSFDRPSTLKKHMLVHTGEKAHTCEMCNRRFGVASNLNRHRRICPHRAAAASSSSNPARSSPSSPADFITGPSNSNSPAPASPPRPRPSPPPPIQDRPITPRPRRRRRRPQPGPPWIPDSLRNFDTSPYLKSVPVPLPPVHPSSPSPPPHSSPTPPPLSPDDRNLAVAYPSPYAQSESFREEERDSFAGVTNTPYHPTGWMGRLPGPAADGAMGAMMGGEGVGGGRVLVF